jgi:hypothetical protein
VHVTRLTLKTLAEEAGAAGFDLLVNGKERAESAAYSHTFRDRGGKKKR